MLIYKCSREEKCFKNSFRSYSSQKLKDNFVKVIERGGEHPEYTEKTLTFLAASKFPEDLLTL